MSQWQPILFTLQELRERIQPYFLRRLKNEVFKEDDATTAKLSQKNEIIVWLRLTACQVWFNAHAWVCVHISCIQLIMQLLCLFVQRQLYEAFLQSEIVLSAFDGSPLAALTVLTLQLFCLYLFEMCKNTMILLVEGWCLILIIVNDHGRVFCWFWSKECIHVNFSSFNQFAVDLSCGLTNFNQYVCYCILRSSEFFPQLLFLWFYWACP